MLRHVIATSLLVLGTAQTDPAASAVHERRGSACSATRISAPMFDDAMEDGMAKIAVHAALPDSGSTPPTREDWIRLYILLSLHSDARGTR